VGYILSEEERNAKRKAGKLGAAARKETIQRRLAAARAEKDKTLDEQSLQQELHKLRQELGVISWTDLANHVPGSTQYTEFLDLGEVVLSGIVWNKKYPQPQDFYDDKELDEDKPIIDQTYFRLAPDWACERMIGIGHYEYPLPEALVHFEIRVFQAFLDWASKHLADKLDWLPQIVQELENRKQGKESFDQALHDREKEESRRAPQYQVPVPDKPTAPIQQPDLDPVISRAPFLDVYDTRNYDIPPQALDYLLHGRG